uniref:Uncharacterized protein n=1 Tax=Peronospora matthiolae TaxID=2874970 RepID=A0AAV1UU55_9STRA
MWDTERRKPRRGGKELELLGPGDANGMWDWHTMTHGLDVRHLQLEQVKLQCR